MQTVLGAELKIIENAGHMAMVESPTMYVCFKFNFVADKKFICIECNCLLFFSVNHHIHEFLNRDFNTPQFDAEVNASIS